MTDVARFALTPTPAMLRAVMHHVTEGVLVVNAAQQIIYSNPACERLVNAQPKALLHKNINKVLALRTLKDNITLQWPLQQIGQSAVGAEITGTGLVQTKDKAQLAITYVMVTLGPSQEQEEPLSMIIIQTIHAAAEVSRLKSEFVSVVSHQLRTPASAVKWYVETLIDNRHGNPINAWQTDKLKQAYQSNERMIHLINDLLNLSRIDSGHFQLKFAPVDIKVLTDGIISEQLYFARAHNVTLLNKIDATIAALPADGDKLHEVLSNLITNAIKYTKIGHQTIEITAKLAKQVVVLGVHDHGMGIPEKDLPHIFEKFYRADNAVESQTEGSGLGLYIAREIIRLHGGDIWLESKLGHGTTVYLSLPLKHAYDDRSKKV